MPQLTARLSDYERDTLLLNVAAIVRHLATAETLTASVQVWNAVANTGNLLSEVQEREKARIENWRKQTD